MLEPPAATLMTSAPRDLPASSKLARVRDPYEPVSFGRNTAITINRIRELQQQAALRPFRAPTRVCVIDEADQMNREAANALLKMLEEPPPDYVFLLTAHERGRLLPTILSRCLDIRCGPLPEALVRQGLASCAVDVPAATVELAARMAGGSMQEARRYLDAGLEERQELAGRPGRGKSSKSRRRCGSSSAGARTRRRPRRVRPVGGRRACAC